MNHDRETFRSSLCNHLSDFASFGVIADVHGRSGEMELQSNQLPTAVPVADLFDCRVGERIHREKTNESCGILRNLCGGKFIFFPGHCRNLGGLQMQRGQPVKISARQDHALGNMRPIKSYNGICGEDCGRLVRRQTLTH
jgi:hypothetical protein